MDILKQIKTSAKCYNRFITDEYLDQSTPLIQLAFVHPFDRDDFAKQLKTDGLISEEELKDWKGRKDERNKKYN